MEVFVFSLVPNAPDSRKSSSWEFLLPQSLILLDVFAPSPRSFEALPFHNERLCLFYWPPLPALFLVQWRFPLYNTSLSLHFDRHISYNRLTLLTGFSVSDFLHAYIIVVGSISCVLDHSLITGPNGLDHKWQRHRRSVRDWHLDWSNYRIKMFNTPRLRYFSYIKIQSVIIMNFVLSQEVIIIQFNRGCHLKLIHKHKNDILCKIKIF